MRNCRHFNRIYGLQLRDIFTTILFCFVLFLVCFVLFLFFFSIFSVELSSPYLHFTTFSLSSSHILLIKSRDKYRVYSTFGFFFLECITPWQPPLSFSRTFLHFTTFRHDVMSKLFWVENKVILEKCSVFKQPNRLGNSTELNSGEEFLARGCDFTTTWNLWSLSL